MDMTISAGVLRPCWLSGCLRQHPGDAGRPGHQEDGRSKWFSWRGRELESERNICHSVYVQNTFKYLYMNTFGVWSMTYEIFEIWMIFDISHILNSCVYVIYIYISFELVHNIYIYTYIKTIKAENKVKYVLLSPM